MYLHYKELYRHYNYDRKGNDKGLRTGRSSPFSKGSRPAAVN